ncbi:hypothetical protein AWZ03_003260 [Drosophila navojoa]|uniref:Uncharacterized protein n=1 Tax=Drosophila navojoa TaxID=7232 RepID=A0A484BR62_DRONA|nr:hypothetical protein AWZ03_003260 [Drosophila navojoa]
MSNGQAATFANDLSCNSSSSSNSSKSHSHGNSNYSNMLPMPNAVWQCAMQQLQLDQPDLQQVLQLRLLLLLLLLLLPLCYSSPTHTTPAAASIERCVHEAHTKKFQ